MKFFILFLLALPMASGSAEECRVYGISDSPQELDCTFGAQTVKLRCRNGQYLLSNFIVKSAYHLEVEEGPVPLVFKTATMELTVLMREKAGIEAELAIDRTHQSGNCQIP